MATVRVNWLYVFDTIDITATVEVAATVTDSLSQKEAYFKSASYKLTVQYLFEFKKSTHLLPIESKIAHIDATNLQPPIPDKSGSELHDQTAYEGRLNYYQFVQEYRLKLLSIINPIKRYFLSQGVIDEIRKGYVFEGHKGQIERLGHMGISSSFGRAKVYNAELCTILCSEELTVIDQASKEQTTVNGTDFIEHYIKGFSEGIQYFEKQYAVPASILYGENRYTYLKDLHANYYHTSIESGPGGWVDVKYSYPIILSNDAIKQIGYLSGIVNQVDALRVKYKEQFIDFDKHAEVNKDIDNSAQTTDSLAPSNSLLASTIEDWLFPFREAGKISPDDYQILSAALKTYVETGHFPRITSQIKVRQVNKKAFGWALYQIYRSEKDTPLSKEYLRFAKDNISIFKGVAFDEDSMLTSNLYKYFTTKTE